MVTGIRCYGQFTSSGTKTYSTAVDIWSVGCIMSEVFTQKALFPSKGEIDTIKKIFKKFGTPSERVCWHWRAA